MSYVSWVADTKFALFPPLKHSLVQLALSMYSAGAALSNMWVVRSKGDQESEGVFSLECLSDTCNISSISQ